MKHRDNFHLSIWDKLQSVRNRFYLHVRQSFAYSRHGYRESTEKKKVTAWIENLNLDTEKVVEVLEVKFQTRPFLAYTNLENYKKNLATLWILEQFQDRFESKQFANLRIALDVGTQDFARAPALVAFLRNYGCKATLTGIEVDAFPLLSNFYSRYDIGKHYERSVPGTKYVAADFFHYDNPADLLFAFFPFVSPHPAIAWGIPARFGSAHSWVESIYRNLNPDGLALVVHQGEWEEVEFDKARELVPQLRILAHKVIQCPFYPHPYPLHARLYIRSK